MKENITKQIEKEMALDYARWDYLYTEGGSDPNWADGCNLNLIRNHIIYHKRKMEELQYFPDIYYRKLPPMVDNSYMAHADKIRAQAKKSLEEYLADATGIVAPRPAYSILENYMLKLTTNHMFAQWEDAIAEYIKNLNY